MDFGISSRALRGVPVRGGENINVRTRPDLIEPNTSHGTIAGNEKIHAAIRVLTGTREPLAPWSLKQPCR